MKYLLAAVNAAHAQPPGVSTAYSWTGCYVGVNGGYGWNKGNSSYQDSNSTADPINFIPATPSIFGTPVLAYIPTPSGTAGSGGLAGGSGGCNYQSQHGWSALKATSTGPIFREQATPRKIQVPVSFKSGQVLSAAFIPLAQRPSRFRCDG